MRDERTQPEGLGRVLAVVDRTCLAGEEEDQWPKMEVAGSIVQAMVATEAGPDSRPAVKGECMSEFNICPNFLMELKVLALIYRWPSRASHRVRGTPVISEADALRKTRIGCFRSIQRFHFADEVKALRGKRNLSKRSHLSRLCPFYDRDGLLRVCVPKKSPVWQYFEEFDKKTEAKCTICQNVVQMSGNTTNLRMHLERHHNIIVKASVKRNAEESTSQLHVKSSEENVEESCAHSSVEPSSSLSKQPKVTTAFDKQMMFKSGSKASECDQKLMRMIVDCNLPVHIVDKESLRDFIRSLNAHYAPPGRKKMTELIEKKYAYLSAKLKNTLSALDAVSITTDIWTDTLNTQSYLGLSAHFTEDNEFKTAMIGVHALNNSHTSDNIQVWIEEILNEWNLKNTQIMAVIADGAANIKSALKACFGAPKVLHCFAHILNLVVTGAISSESLITDLLKKVKNVVTFFKHSVNAADALKKETPLKLKQSCETRWNSTYYMIQRYLKVHDYVIKILCNTKSAPPVISADEVDILQEMTSLLEPFEYATKLVSGEKYVTISKVIPLIFEMKTGMDTYEPTTLQCSKLKNELIEQFNTRFKSTEDISIIAQATILDPRFKKVPFSDHDACSRAIQKISDTLYIENLVDRTPFHSEKIDRPTDKSTGGYWTHYKKKAQQTNEQMNPEDVHLNELQHYLMMPTEDFDTCNPLVFWSKYNNSPLGKYAKKLLSVVATSVPCERIFSKAGRILTEDRNRLSPKHFKEFLFSSSIDRDNWDFCNS
uniref:BED-type domain-containing protein n=1 Tax=Trichogramma kaykai TaxID=54128 RepID=A0ABD2W1A3_9HYME